MPEHPSPYPDSLGHARSRIGDFLRESLHGRELPGISRGVEYQLETGGKRIRPTLSLWLGEALGGDEQRLLPFAAAVELLHNVFLIHDDIEDGDTYRRGAPTLWAHIGIEEALNVSDFLLAEAYRLVGSTESPAAVTVDLFREFSDTFRITVEGQALDLAYRANADFTQHLYEQIIVRKTGRYLALGWVGAARIAGRSAAEAAAFWDVGRALGPAFQIRDDVLDLSDGKGRGGEVACDLREGKPSILVALTLESAEVTATDKATLVEILQTGRDDTTSSQIDWAVALFESCGAIAEATAEAHRRAAAGVEIIESIDYLPSEAVETFRAIARYLVDREV
ncbi:MAG: polyprenyl synthetase family protein [Planctomycetota bacterium]